LRALIRHLFGGGIDEDARLKWGHRTSRWLMPTRSKPSCVKAMRKLHFRHNSDLRNTLIPNVFPLLAIFPA
jgi:hypothetical protein